MPRRRSPAATARASLSSSSAISTLTSLSPDSGCQVFARWPRGGDSQVTADTALSPALAYTWSRQFVAEGETEDEREFRRRLGPAAAMAAGGAGGGRRDQRG